MMPYSQCSGCQCRRSLHRPLAMLGPAVQATLPRKLLSDTAILKMLVALQAATVRVKSESSASGIKLVVNSLALLLSKNARNLQGEISRHQIELRQAGTSIKDLRFVGV